MAEEIFGFQIFQLRAVALRIKEKCLCVDLLLS